VPPIGPVDEPGVKYVLLLLGGHEQAFPQLKLLAKPSATLRV